MAGGAGATAVMAVPRRTRLGRAWRHIWRRWRNALLANPDFREIAAGNKLTRPVARREARALFDLCAGFVYSQVLAACVELDLFDRLAGRPQRIATLAAASGLDPPAMMTLLRAAASLGLIEIDGDAVTLGPRGAAFRATPGLAAMVRHHALLYRDLADPLAVLRRGKGETLAGFWPYDGAGGGPDDGGGRRAYSALMAATQPMVAAEILAAHDVRRHRVLLDLGGGDGAFLRAAAARAPGLGLWLADLPDVAEAAGARFAETGFGARARCFGLDIRRDALPHGADAVSLIRVLHDHDDADAMAILRNARAALAPGGVLLIGEPMAAAPGAAPMGAYFGLYLAAMGRGRPRSAREIATMAQAAGFAEARPVATRLPLIAGLVRARA